MSFLFKVKIQGVSQRIEFSENELNQTNTAVSEAFYAKGKIEFQSLKYKSCCIFISNGFALLCSVRSI